MEQVIKGDSLPLSWSNAKQNLDHDLMRAALQPPLFAQYIYSLLQHHMVCLDSEAKKRPGLMVNDQFPSREYGLHLKSLVMAVKLSGY